MVRMAVPVFQGGRLIDVTWFKELEFIQLCHGEIQTCWLCESVFNPLYYMCRKIGHAWMFLDLSHYFLCVAFLLLPSVSYLRIKGFFCILVSPEGGKQTYLNIHHLLIIAWGAQWSPEARFMGACSVSLLACGTFLSPPKPVCFPTPPYTHFWASNVYGDSQVSTFLTKPFGSVHDS